MKRNALLLILVGLVLVTYGQSASHRKLSGYVRQAVVENRRLPSTRSVQRARSITAFVKLEKEQADNVLRKYGCKKYAQWEDIVIASIPLENVEALATERAVSRIEANGRASALMDTTALVVNALPIYESSNSHPAYTGAGVVIGVEDVGFDLMHPNYYDASGSQYRIGAFWDQLSKDTIGSPLPVGRDYIGQAEILAYGQSTDAPTQTHGTHTSGTAAGSGYDTKYRGMAYESDICLVSNAITDDIEYIDSADIYKYTTAIDALGMQYCFDYASRQGKPCVVSFSEGYHPYLDEEDSLFSAVLDRMTGPGRIIVASAGNESIEKTYIEKPAVQQEAGAFIHCYKESAVYRLVSAEPLRLMLYYYRGDSGVPTDTLSLTTAEVVYDSIMTKELICGEDSLSLSVYRSTSSFIDEDVYQVLVKANHTLDELSPLALVVGGEGEIKVYGGSRMAFKSHEVDSRWSAAQKGHDILAPGCFPAVICVGATAHRMEYVNEKGAVQGTLSGTVQGLLGPFSSTGPTISGLMKPDVVAPGVNVISSYSHIYHPEKYIVSWSEFQGEQYPWALYSGTSMSAPVVAGVIALWLQAKPDLTPEEVLQVLSRTCRQPDSTLTYPNNHYGYGEIDAYRGLLDILGLSKVEGISLHQPQQVQIRPVGRGLRLLFDDVLQAPVIIRLYDLSGVCIYSERLDINGTEMTIDLPSVQEDVYAVQIETRDKTIRGSCLVRL